MALRGTYTYDAFEVVRTKTGIEVQKKVEFAILQNAMFEMDYGSKRRNIIYNSLQRGIEIRVNGHHCIQTKNDPDIKRLIKEKKIEMFNVPSSTFKHTYLRIK